MSPSTLHILGHLCLLAASLCTTMSVRTEWNASQGKNQTAERQRNKLSSLFSENVYSSDNVEEGYINLGSIHSFTRDLSGQHRIDVLMSTLYAQDQASAHYDKVDHPLEWYNEYISTLKSIGWKIDPFSFKVYSPTSPMYSIMEALKPILSPHCTDVQKKVAVEVNEAYRALKDADDKVFTFVINACRNQTGLHAMSGNFQILPSTASGSTVITVFGAFYFEATVKVYRFLCYTLEQAQIILSNAIQIGILDPSVYSSHRSYVLSQLGNKANSVKKIPLKQ